MKKIAFVLPALVALSLVASYTAPARADTVVIHRHHGQYWHPHHDKTVITKKHDHDYDHHD